MYAVAVFPDGRRVVSGGKDGSVRVWDVGSGECVCILEGHADSVAVFPDGRRVVSSGRGRLVSGGFEDGLVRVWDVASGECVRSLEGPFGSTPVVAVFPDGRWVVSGSGDGLVRVWDVASGECLRTLKGHTAWVNAVAVFPDGRRVVSGGDDGSVRVWELDWEYEFPDPVDWDDGARAFLEIFLTLHTPYVSDGLSREGHPSWSDEEFEQLLTDLGWRGYGWLRPEGVRTELEEMAAERGWRREA